MKKIQLKTNIMCGSCLAKVSPILNETFGVSNWEVDLKDPIRMLTVTSDNATAGEVINAVEKAGYKAEEQVLY